MVIFLETGFSPANDVGSKIVWRECVSEQDAFDCSLSGKESVPMHRSILMKRSHAIFLKNLTRKEISNLSIRR